MKLIPLVFISYLALELRAPQFKSTPIFSENGATTADSEICSKIGTDIFKTGGNAIDSAIASSICQGLVFPFASGIGGGAIMLIHFSDGKSKFINFRETAPNKSHRDMFVNKSSILTGLSVAIPSEIKGFEYAHKLYGKLGWKELFKPTIKLAINGFPTPELLEIKLRKINEIDNKDIFKLFSINGKLIRKGQIFKNPQLAKTLKNIALYGSKVFYSGNIGKAIKKKVRLEGGILTMKDLRDYKPTIRNGIKAMFRNKTYYTSPLPSSGLVLISILNIIESLSNKISFDIKDIHLVTEAFKIAFGQRMKLGDDLFLDLKKISSKMKSKIYSKRLSLIIGELSHDPSYYLKRLKHMPKFHGTSHVNTYLKHRHAYKVVPVSVSVTSTINLSFGSKLVVPKYGIILNNEMDDFSTPGRHNHFKLPPSKSNYIKPGKTPLSSMAPVIFVDKNNTPTLVIGASGGSRIITAIAQAIIEFIDGDLKINEIVDLPRYHHQLIPNELWIEKGFTKNFIKGMEIRNHTVKFYDSTKSNVSGIQIFNSTHLLSAVDGRRKGCSSGF